MLKNKNKGFSLVELIVVIAILVVFAAVLIPSLLQYTENSRAQKDESAMDEVVNAVQLAMADQDCYDEMLQYSCTNNYITYTDSSGVYGQVIADGEYWAPDGSGRATTITFNPEVGPNGDTIYNLDTAIINDMTYGNGSVAQNRVMEGALIDNNQCYLKNATLNGKTTAYLYNKVRQTVGDNLITTSATYRNSSFTVFIKFTQKDNITVADVNGSFNGTNLYEGAVASKGSGTNSYNDNGDAIITVTTPGTTKSEYVNSDLQGGGNFGSVNGVETFLAAWRMDSFISANNPTRIIFERGGAVDGVDLSNTQDGSILATIEGDTCYIRTKTYEYRAYGVKLPDNSYALFYNSTNNPYQNIKYLDVSGCDASNVINASNMFNYVGQNVQDEFEIVGLNNWNTQNITDMSYMFQFTGENAKKWSIGDLSQWDVSNVTNMHSLFNWAGHMYKGEWTVGDLSQWNVSNVTRMNKMFNESAYEARSFNVGDLSNWDISNVKTMNLMFSFVGAHASEYVFFDITKWDTSKVEDMSNMFRRFYQHLDYKLDLRNWHFPTDIQGISSSEIFSFNYNVGDKVLVPWE